MDNWKEYALTIWDYMRLDMPLVKSDVIIALGSHDIRVAERAADLWSEGWAPLIVFSGGLGHLTEGVFDKPEAEIFADAAAALGVPRDRMLIESSSTNTGQNVVFSRNLLMEHGHNVQSVIAIQKPYMERRTLATFQAQWPDLPSLTVTSMPCTFDSYPNAATGDSRAVTSIMVGDLQRIREYPRLGFQSEQHIPDRVWTAQELLVKQGFTQHLMK